VSCEIHIHTTVQSTIEFIYSIRFKNFTGGGRAGTELGENEAKLIGGIEALSQPGLVC
jgi:hypothetical protein